VILYVRVCAKREPPVLHFDYVVEFARVNRWHSYRKPWDVLSTAVAFKENVPRLLVDQFVVSVLLAARSEVPLFKKVAWEFNTVNRVSVSELT